MEVSNYFGLGSIVALFLVTLIPYNTAAQSDGTVRVLVSSEEDGNSVVGAQVVLRSYSEVEGVGDIQYAGVTDNDGLFESSDVQPGKYRLEITFVGYKTYTEILTVESGELEIRRIDLKVSVEKLGKVLVEAEREVTTGEVGVDKISNIEVGRIPTPGTGGDLASYLQTLPGVVSSGDRGGDINIRGGTSTQNKVLVDNLPIIKPFHISSLFSAFPNHSIKSVDLYAGGFGAEYMGSTSAIIDVNLKPGNMKEFSGRGAISPYLMSLQLEGPIEQGQESFMLMGRKSIYNKTAPTLIGQEGGINFYDLVGRYSYQGDNYNCNITGVSTFDRGKINPQRNLSLSWSNTVIGGRCLGFDRMYEHPIELTIGYTNYTNSESTPAISERSATHSQMFAKVDHEQEVFGLSVNYGFRINFSSYAATLSERYTSVESFNTNIPIFRIYGSTEWQPNKYLTLQPSFASQATFKASPTLEPRLRISYLPAGTIDKEFSLAVGKYYQIMNGIRDQRDAGTVFTVLKPVLGEPLQRALHGLLGYEHHVGNYFEANLEGFAKSYKNISVPQWTPIAKLNTKTTLAKGFAYGFDLRLKYEKRPFYFSLGYGWSKVRYEAVSESLGAWIEEPIFSYSPSFDQRHKLNTITSYKFGEFTTSVTWEFSSGKPYTQIYGFDLALDIPRELPIQDSGTSRILYSRPYGERFPAYHRLDISLKRSFQLSSQVSIDTEVGVLNVYNRKNIFYYDVNTLQRVNQTPRMLYGSVSMQF